MKSISKKTIITGLIILIVGLCAIYAPDIISNNKNKPYIATELKALETQKEIWTDVVELCDEWTSGKITREELATQGNELMKQYKSIEGDTLDNSVEIMSDSNTIKLETQVMLFDLVRGFELDGNEYASKEKIKEETLKYIYPKRAKTFYNLYDYFVDKYK